MTDEREKDPDREQENTKAQQGRADSKQSHYSSDSHPGSNHRKVYFQQELKRLRSTLEREGSKIHKPQRKAYTPYTFTTLQPYYDTVIQSKVIEHEPKEPKGYVNRNTAIGLTDPWVDHHMDRDLPLKQDEREDEAETAPSPTDDRKQGRTGKNKHKKEGSTRLPKFPAVQMPTGDLASKPLNYGDVPLLRQEIKTKYGTNADKKVNDEYERTRNDFYRMDLDRLDEYHPASRGHMTQAYMAYLQNNPGSKRAIKECITEAEKELREIEESCGTSRPVSAVSRHSHRPASSRSRHSVKQE